MIKQEIFKNCTVSIKDDKGKEYHFEKPTGFEVELLKVMYGAYHNIIAMVIDEYRMVWAICYSTTGFVYDGREGAKKFALIPTTFEEFFKDVK